MFRFRIVRSFSYWDLNRTSGLRSCSPRRDGTSFDFSNTPKLTEMDFRVRARSIAWMILPTPTIIPDHRDFRWISIHIPNPPLTLSTSGKPSRNYSMASRWTSTAFSSVLGLAWDSSENSMSSAMEREPVYENAGCYVSGDNGINLTG